MLAHGPQIFIQTLAGARNFQQQTADSLVALLFFSCAMHRPLWAGDTAYPVSEIVQLTPQHTTGIIEMRVTILNLYEKFLMDGTHHFLLKKSSHLLTYHYGEICVQRP